MLELFNVTKIYNNGGSSVKALDSINLKFKDNGLICICGESGSGKTTLLNLISLIDNFDYGDINYNDKNYSILDDNKKNELRRNNIGIIFQDNNLLNNLSVYENLILSIGIQNNDENIDNILNYLGIYKYKYSNIFDLSGGERQRVAIARCLLKDNNLILCDEPFASLDKENSIKILEYLKDISKNRLVIIVSHNENLVYDYADRMIKLSDGRIEEDVIINDNNIILSNSNLYKDSVGSKEYLRYLYKSSNKFNFNKIITNILFIILNLFLLITFSSIFLEDIKDDITVQTIKNNGVSYASCSTYDKNYVIDDNINKDNYYYYSYIQEDIVEINDELLEMYNLQLIGRLPQNFLEIVITDFYYYYILKMEQNFKDVDLESVSYAFNNDKWLKIKYNVVGILDTDFDYNDYELYFNNASNNNSNSEYKMTNQEYNEFIKQSQNLLYMANYSIYNKLFVNNTFFEPDNFIILDSKSLSYSKNNLKKICKIDNSFKTYNKKIAINPNMFSLYYSYEYDKTKYDKTSFDSYYNIDSSLEDYIAICHSISAANEYKNLYGDKIEFVLDNNVIKIDINDVFFSDMIDSYDYDEVTQKYPYFIFVNDEVFNMLYNNKTFDYKGFLVNPSKIENLKNFIIEMEKNGSIHCMPLNNYTYNLVSSLTYSKFDVIIYLIIQWILMLCLYTLINYLYIYKKRHDIGLLKSIGFSDKTVLKNEVITKTLSFILISIIASIIYCIFCYFINNYLNENLKTNLLYYYFDYKTVLFILLILILCSICIVFIVNHFSKKKIVDLLKR